ncbi:MAG: helix-turn-helix domain-containing protein [Planctomycetota bacterium]|nr:helix-turn-helix domain-containing protein [Planctomycetota bacterium]
MSYWPRISSDVIRDGSLKPLTFRVYAALAMYADKDTGECYPSQQTLADDIGVSERAIRKHIAILLKKEHVEIVTRRRRDSVVYRIGTQDRNSGAEQDDKDTETRPGQRCRSKDQNRNGGAVKTGTAVPDTIKHPNEHIRKKRSDENGPLAQDDIDRAAFEVLRLIGHEHFEDRLIAQVAYLTATGAIPIGHAIDAANAVREYRPDNPVAYFRTIFTESVGPGNLKMLLGCVPRGTKLTEPKLISEFNTGASLRVVAEDEDSDFEMNRRRNEFLDGVDKLKATG